MNAAPLLAETCWPEVAAGGTLLLPLGSLEQHGPHLPLDTDTRIAEALAVRAARRTAYPTFVAPVLPYGASGEHEGFPGTVSIGSTALAAVVVELVRSATRTFSRVVLVCGHGGNVDGVQRALAVLRQEQRDAVGWFPAVPVGDAHAGRTETSLLLAIAPRLVRPAPWASGATEPLAELLPRLRSVGVRPVSPNGVLGAPEGLPPRRASAFWTSSPISWRARRGRRRCGPREPAATGGGRDGSRAGHRTGRIVAASAAGWWWSLSTGRRLPDLEHLLGYRLAAAADLAETVRGAPAGVVRAVTADVRDRAALADVVDEVLVRYQRLDAAVAAAGIIAGGEPLWQTPDEQLSALLEVNVGGVAHLAACAIPAMLAAPTPRAGRFVAVASAAAHRVLFHLAAYSASKAACVGLVRGLAADLRGTGVTANVVSPGSTRTDMLDRTAELYDLPTSAAFAEHALLERLLEPEEIAAVVGYLCSGDSAALTGAVLAADGGLTA